MCLVVENVVHVAFNDACFADVLVTEKDDLVLDSRCNVTGICRRDLLLLLLFNHVYNFIKSFGIVFVDPRLVLEEVWLCVVQRVHDIEGKPSAEFL